MRRGLILTLLTVLMVACGGPSKEDSQAAVADETKAQEAAIDMEARGGAAN